MLRAVHDTDVVLAAQRSTFESWAETFAMPPADNSGGGAYDAGVKPFEEIVQFIADAAGAERLSAFRPSAAAESRVSELLAKQQEETLTPKEREELQLFVQLDHVMSLAKARAQARHGTRRLMKA